MKVTTLLLAILILILANMAHALPVNREFRDLKLPSQVMLERQTITAPGASSIARLLTANAGDSTGTAVAVTSFLAQPDVPRNITVFPGGSTGDVKAGNIVVSGTDFFGNSISEDIAVIANQASQAVGSKAFKTVTQVTFPAEDTPFQATWSVGMGSKLGLKRCMDSNGHVFEATLGGALEATRPTGAANASAIASNTAQLSTALNGSDVEVFFIQNFRCFP